MERTTLIRIGSYCILFISIIALPWWFTLFIALTFLFYFSRYYEIFVFAFLMDMLYAAPVERFGGTVVVSLAVSLILFISIELLKRRLRFY